MAVTDLLDPVSPEGGLVSLATVEDWMQGRTLYGGASALIAYTAAVRAFPDLPLLRSAQITFVGPVGAEISIRREVVRQGRNVTQVRSELWCDGGCALTALFLFGAQREPNARHRTAAVSDLPSLPEVAEAVMSDRAPAFLRHNFEFGRAQDERGPGPPVVRRWVRLVGCDELDPVSQMVLLGDALPPGAMRVMQRPGQNSSMNWSFNLLDAEPATSEGWWLSENASLHADHGYSSERLRLWNASGQQILDGMQCAAIFG